MSGSSRRHPGILFLKPGSSTIANMQWLESWELDTLESLSTFEIGSTFTQLNRKTLLSFKIISDLRKHAGVKKRQRKFREWSSEATIPTTFWPPHLHPIQPVVFESLGSCYLHHAKPSKPTSWVQVTSCITHCLGYLEHTLPFPAESKSLRLSRWGNIQRANDYENMSLLSKWFTWGQGIG